MKAKTRKTAPETQQPVDLMALFAPQNKSAATAGEIYIRTPEAAAAAEEMLAAKDDLDRAKAREEVAKSVIIPMALEAWTTANDKRSDPETSVRIPTNDGPGALVMFQGLWTPKGDAMAQVPNDLKVSTVQIKIDTDKIPPAAVQPFIAGILKLAADCGCSDAIQASGGFRPVKTFNAQRFHRFTPQQNLALEQAGLGTRVAVRRSAK